MDLQVTISTVDGVTTLGLVGELDLASQVALVNALAALRTEGRDDVVVDLSRLSFLDSTGIGTLVAHVVDARERGHSLRVVGASGMPLRALEVTGVLDILTGPG